MPSSKKEPVYITCDHREEPSGIPAILRDDPQVVLTIANNLDHGDYDGGTVVIERKTARDLADSIIDKRLFKQIEARKDAGILTPWVMVIQGDPYRSGRKMFPAAISGALSYLAVIERISVLQAPDLQTAAMTIKTVIRHAQQGLGYVINTGPQKPKSLVGRQVQVVQSLPSVGLTRGAALLKHFGTPRALFGAPASLLEGVDGIGPASAAAIAEVLDTPWTD